MAELGAVCVYCGSNKGRKPAYEAAARTLGRSLAAEGIGLVYGGGGIGLMGVVARSVLEAGGHVTGIIPGFLREREAKFDAVTDLHVVETMHERKQLMFDRADAFVVLPGGIGTLEETIEMLTWAQLQAHAKPILLLNVDGYWTPLVALLDHVVAEGFARPSVHDLWHVITHAEDVVPTLRRLCARPREPLAPAAGGPEVL
ncbi:MAG: TIGR00730 family Rossman fold protein [Alphaproteobacteria bacterium]|nr:TIGR00730 family Rossman fold protein [Alphaproteobacteria bacterium]